MIDFLGHIMLMFIMSGITFLFICAVVSALGYLITQVQRTGLPRIIRKLTRK